MVPWGRLGLRARSLLYTTGPERSRAAIRDGDINVAHEERAGFSAILARGFIDSFHCPVGAVLEVPVGARPHSLPRVPRVR